MSRLFLMFAIACQVEDAAPSWHADVAPIIDAHCAHCHRTGGVAPFTLSSYADAAAVAPLIKGAVEARTMPPWGATGADVGLRFDVSLSEEQIALVGAWADAGAPEGDPSKPGDPIHLELGELPSYDVELKLPEPYATKATPGEDEYRCFLFEWPYEEPIYVTGFELIPGNAEVAHHAVTFMIPPRSVDLAHRFDEWDDGPGYDCFGTASHASFEQLTDGEFFDQRFISGWAPGMPGMEYDEGRIGIEIAPGSLIALQMHYSNVGAPLPLDQTAVRFRVSETTEREGYYMPWMNMAWPTAPQTMLIPAGASDVVHRYRSPATTSINATLLGASTEVVQDGMLLYSVLPHTHRLGQEITYRLHRTDGTTTTLLYVDRYDFNWQREYVFDEPITVLPGDELEVECLFHNTLDWRTNRRAYPVEPMDVGWGEGTNDEMCVAHSLMTSLE